MRLAALTLALLATLTSTSLGDVSVSGTLETPTVVSAGTRSILYYLQLHAGPTAQRFAIRLTPGSFATAGGLPEGQSVDGPAAVALQGPGTLGQTVQSPSVIAACSSRVSAFHGYATGPATVDVYLPANANTVLAVRYFTGRRAPWVDGDYRLRFTIEPFLVGSYSASSPLAGPATVTRASVLVSSGPSVGGRTGAHILLSASPRARPSNPYGAVTLAAGAAVRISGRLLPARSGRAILLEYSRGAGRLHTLQTLHTNAAGRFTAQPWHPSSSGTYELWASYPDQPGGLAADGTSCPLRFRVR